MFLKCLVSCCVCLALQFFSHVSDFDTFCISKFIVVSSFLFLGSLSSSDDQFNIIDDTRWIVDCGTLYRDVTSDSGNDFEVLNFRSLCCIRSDNQLFKGLHGRKFNPH